MCIAEGPTGTIYRDRLLVEFTCGAPILAVDLFVTYKIIAIAIKAHEKRIWSPARVSLIQTLQRTCGALMGGWAIRCTDSQYNAIETFDDDLLLRDLRSEVETLNRAEPQDPWAYERRSTGLISSKTSVLYRTICASP